ncbi:MAG: hypothetical protein IKW74_01195, partial [Thermoguttaceae bacterium]|nr:hypothetical protein [Thermoguttaceae bacterium]
MKSRSQKDFAVGNGVNDFGSRSNRSENTADPVTGKVLKRVEYRIPDTGIFSPVIRGLSVSDTTITGVVPDTEPLTSENMSDSQSPEPKKLRLAVLPVEEEIEHGTADTKNSAGDNILRKPDTAISDTAGIRSAADGNLNKAVDGSGETVTVAQDKRTMALDRDNPAITAQNTIGDGDGVSEVTEKNSLAVSDGDDERIAGNTVSHEVEETEDLRNSLEGESDVLDFQKNCSQWGRYYANSESGNAPALCRHMLDRASHEVFNLGNALQQAILNGYRIIGFNGITIQSGCSTLMVSAAGELMNRGLSVLLMDANFENPSLASLFDLDPDYGWETAILNREPLESSIIRLAIPASDFEAFPGNRKKETSLRSREQFLHLLPLTSQATDQIRLASCEKILTQNLRDLTHRFDVILIDTGACLPENPSESVFRMLRLGEDGFYLVDNVRETNKNHLDELLSECYRYEHPCLGT